jgi:hypothetical protein
VTVDAASRLAPRHARALRLLVRVLVGVMQFPAIALDPAGGAGAGAGTKEKAAAKEKRVAPADTERAGPAVLKLWGLSLGMTLDLVSAMVGPGPLALPDELGLGLGADVVGLGAPLPPSLTSVFPRFSYPDVNFWIWVFGRRYREVVRGWEASMRSGGTNDRRINWTGSALNTFYAAVRKALVVVFVARALGLLLALSLSAWWLFGP